jgi:hypothetical protein
MRCPNCDHEVLGMGVAQCPSCGAALPPSLLGSDAGHLNLGIAPSSDRPVSGGSSVPDPGHRRRIVLVVASVVAGTVVLYGGALEILAIAVNQANVLRPETVVYQNTLHGFPGGWPNGTACSYGSDGYHVDGNGLCYAPSDPLSDVAVTVSVTQTGGLFTVSPALWCAPRLMW